MTWNRLFQTGFEELYLGEASNLYAYHPFGIIDDPYTDNKSIGVINSRNWYGVNDIGIWNQMRVGCYIRFQETFNDDPIIFSVNGYISSLMPTSASMRWYYSDDNKDFYLTIGGTEVIRWSPYITPGFEMGQWSYLSIVAKAGVGGYISCYVNGFLQMRYDSNILTDIREIGFPGGSFYGSVSTFSMDDVYIDGTNDNEPDSAPPSPRFHMLPASSLGSNSEWELIGADNRLSIFTPGTRINYSFPILAAKEDGLEETFRVGSVASYDEQDIESIIVKALAMYGDITRTPSINFIARDGGGNTDVSGDITLEKAYRMQFHRFPLRPDGTQWTHSMHDVEFGVRSVDNVDDDFPAYDTRWNPALIITGESYTSLEGQDVQQAEEAGGGQVDGIYFNTGYKSMGGPANRNVATLRLPSFQSLRCGFWINITSTDASSIDIFRFTNESNAVQWAFTLNNDRRTIYMRLTSTALLSPVSSLDTPARKFGEFVHFGLALSPTSASLYINGRLIITSAITLSTILAASTKFGVFVRAANNTYWAYDDFYIDLSSSAISNAPPPVRRFSPYVINKQGSLYEWTYPYLNVPFTKFDVPSTNDYITSDSSGLSALFQKNPHLHYPGWEPIGVGLQPYANRGTLGIDAIIELDGNTLQRAMQPIASPDTGWWSYNAYTELDPDGLPWDIDKISRVQVGVKIP